MSYIPCYLAGAKPPIGVEQVTGVGPVFKHWQCLVITDILYLHLVGRERVELPESKTTDLQSAPLPLTVYLPK